MFDRVSRCLISELPKRHGIIERAAIQAWSEYMNEPRFAPFIRNAVDAMQRACTPDVVLHDADMLKGLDLSGELTRLHQPVLILAPGQSPFISREHAQGLDALLLMPSW